MLPAQAQSTQPQKTPWHKKWWAAPAIGAGALGAGYLTDQLVNGGKLTSSLLDSTKPESSAPPAPSFTPSPSAFTSSFRPPVDRFQTMMDKARDFVPGDEDQSSPLFSKAIDTPIMAAGGLANAGLIGNGVVNTVGNLAGKSLSLGAGPLKVLGRASQIAAPLMDYHAGSDKFYADGMTDLFGVSPETGKRISGGIGGAIGVASMINPVVSVASNLALNGMSAIGHKMNDNINQADAASHNNSVVFKTILDSIKAGDTATIDKIKQRFPNLPNEQFYENLPRAKQLVSGLYNKL